MGNNPLTLAAGLARAKKEYSALEGLDEQELLFLINRAQEEKEILRNHKRALEPINLNWAESFLTRLQVPRGWGDLLLHLTNPLIEGIPLGITSAMIYNYATDPALVLLLRLVIVYTLLARGGKKDAENAIITRNDSIKIQEDEDYLEFLILNAQELWDVLKLMPRLRNGGTRLLPRMIDCIDKIIKD